MDPRILLNKLISFILVLYANPSLPRNLVQTVITFMDNFICEALFESIKKDILEILNEENCLNENQRKITNIFDKYSLIFKTVSSEEKRINILKENGLLNYEEYMIGTTFISKVVNNDVKYISKQLFAIFVPLRKSLKLFLEVPGMYNHIIDHINNLRKEKSIITSILQCDLWKKYDKVNEEEIVLPVNIFFDDLEVGNALGSHAGTNKFGVVYANLACLPSNIASRLSSILFTQLFYTNDKKETTNEGVFKKLVEELNFLQTHGITVNVSGILKKIKFQLLLVLGDNLGLNGILGFNESFNSTYFCRLCKMSANDTKISIIEDTSLLRTSQNYEEDLATNDPSKTGIKEPCIFNMVNGFHVTENLSLDMMHDLLEGICKYDLNVIMLELIFKKKYFTLEYLNNKIQSFNYGFLESSNKPPLIMVNRLKNDKLNLKMSAAEMLCLVRYFGVIIGEKVPQNEIFWCLFKYLRQIVDILTSPTVQKCDINVLRQLIEKHNKLYLEICGPLKPKYHFLIHYPSILERNGPCIKFWSMRYESCHQSIKANAQSTNCKKNLLKTIGTKQTLAMCKLFHSLRYDDDIKFAGCDKNDYSFKHLFDKKDCDSIQCYNQVEISNIMYKSSLIIVINLQKSEIEFGEILKIIRLKNDIYFYVKVYKELIFDEHYHAFEVYNENNECRLVKFDELPQTAFSLLAINNKRKYIVPRHAL